MAVKPLEAMIDVARQDPALRSMTPRVARLYDRLQWRMRQPQVGWGADLSLVDDPGFAELPLIVRKARSFEYAMLHMPIAIEEDDLVVGNAVLDGAIVRTTPPRYATDAELAQAEAEGRTINHGLAHKTPHYGDVLTKGLRGILDEIAAQVDMLEREQPTDERAAALDLYEAMRIELGAVISLAHRFADLADAQSAEQIDAARAEELAEIAAVCRRVPEFPATTFAEAVQAFWLVQFALFMTHVQLSLGRIDQFLWPCLDADLSAGRTTLVQAQERLDCLWMRCNDRGQIDRAQFVMTKEPEERAEGAQRQPSSSRRGLVTDMSPQPWTAGHRVRWITGEDRADAINHWGENVLISGIHPDGQDGTNALTYLCLNAHEKFSLTSPVLTARLHKASPPELVLRVAEVLKEDGSGMPYINNDDVIIGAYVDKGVALQDARDYANSNCWETLIEGRSDQEIVRGVNFLLLLELALHRGASWRHGAMGPDTGDPATFDTFDDLLDAWTAQMDDLVGQALKFIGDAVTRGDLEHSSHGAYRHFPLLSALTRDCIARGRDVTRLGARYTIWHVMAEAVANAVDALIAIKTLVYDHGELTMAELLAALDANWEGHEALRQRIIRRMPKFANDAPEADAIGHALMTRFLERCAVHAEPYAPTVIFTPGVGTFSWIQSIGYEVAASADGRFAGEAVAANLSPAAGADQSGPLAALNSSLAMCPCDLAAGAPMDLRHSKASLRGEAGTQRLAAIISGFIAQGGNMMTMTITDVEELKRAMVEPEKYRQLRVRMGGWSAYFCMLGRDQQLIQIKRGEQGLA